MFKIYIYSIIHCIVYTALKYRYSIIYLLKYTVQNNNNNNTEKEA